MERDEQIGALYAMLINLSAELTIAQSLTLAMIDTAQDRAALAERFEAHLEAVRTRYLFSEAHESMLQSMDSAADAVRAVLQG